jgi:hypothetical protein
VLARGRWVPVFAVRALPLPRVTVGRSRQVPGHRDATDHNVVQIVHDSGIKICNFGGHSAVLMIDLCIFCT